VKNGLKKGAAWLLFLTLLACGTGLLGNGLYIHAKGLVAQLLLFHSWARSQQCGEIVRPWPWADCYPVGRLTVTRLGVDLIILEGDSGEVLAFGPGHVPASSAIGGPGNCVLAGHRDTSFAFVRQLHAGDTITVEDNKQGIHRYRVRGSEVVDSEQLYLQTETPPWLTLITCYPFDGLEPGSPFRYVVYAERVASINAVALAEI
jgi:sortase A